MNNKRELFSGWKIYSPMFYNRVSGKVHFWLLHAWADDKTILLARVFEEVYSLCLRLTNKSSVIEYSYSIGAVDFPVVIYQFKWFYQCFLLFIGCELAF